MTLNYGDMQDRIADELIRNDLTSQIKKAIQTAIRNYERERFHFNETRATASTVDGQEYYDLPDDFISMDSLTVTITDRQYPLIPRTWQYIEDISWGGKTWQGYPQDYAIYAGQFRLYPIPNGAYELELAYIKKLAELEDRSDTNEWMNQGEELIRCRAKRELFMHVIYDMELSQVMQSAETQALKSLYDRYGKYALTTKLRPTSW